MMMAQHKISGFFLLLLLSVVLHAQQPQNGAAVPQAAVQNAPAPAPAGPLAWSSLSSAQQEVLAPLKKNWEQLPPDAQQRMQRGASRWTQMTPEQRGNTQQRFQKWNALTPEQRGQIRERYQRFGTLPPQQQRRLRQTYQRFSALPPEQRQKLRARWNGMSPQERQAALAEARTHGSPQATPHAAPQAAPQAEGARNKPTPAKPKPGARMHPKAARVDKQHQ